TLGERIALADAPPGPWYVVAKDVARNQLVVAKERAVPIEGASLQFGEANWFTEPGEMLTAQYRYHGPVVHGALSTDEQAFIPEGPLPEPAAPGQSLVFYQGERLLGGGILC
ncbi:MAG TPA: aminomethyltransferase beta-barrel domain-containing protein, partial [Candidatus Paceibacterota bacterium]